MLFQKNTATLDSTKGILLCIDDALPVLEIMACVLEECGYSVLVSADIKRGLTLFQTHEVDLVILDQEMPDMSGHQVALEMKRIKPAVPIVLHSGCTEPPAEALSVVNAFVPKGTSLRLLVSEVAQIMALRETLSE